MVLADVDAAMARTAAERLAQTGIPVQTGGVTEAIAQSEILFLAVPFVAALQIARTAALAGKIVVDVTNPLKEDFSGLLFGFDASAAEQISEAAVGASVVKGFNTVFAQLYDNGLDFAGRKVAVFLASDDAEASTRVAVSICAISIRSSIIRQVGMKPGLYSTQAIPVPLNWQVSAVAPMR